LSIILLIGFISNSNLLLAQVNLPSRFPDRIILNPAPDPSTAMAVTWRTDTTVKTAFVEIQPASDTRIKPEDSKSFKARSAKVSYSYQNEPTIYAFQHSFIFSGLNPSGKYIYRVGSEKEWSEWFEFSTPSANEGEYSFIYFGDPQVNLKSEWSRVVRKAYQQSPDCHFMLYAGDIINRAGRDIEWDEWFKAGAHIFSMVPQVLTPGNHDYDGLDLDKHWNMQFTQPTNGPEGLDGTCFFIDYPHLRLISIDSAADSELENENGAIINLQKAWLDSVLYTNTKEWVVLTTHLPFYSTKDSRDNPQLRKHFQPILDKYKVDLVLTGHDHSYGRGKASDNPNIKPSVVYVVSVSGPKLYPSGTKSWMEKSGGDLQLFQKITISGNSLTYKSYTVSGDIFDEFLIQRKKNGDKKFVEKKQGI
jgi:hypothetical protein